MVACYLVCRKSCHLATLGTLAGCAVYVPTVPSTPLVEKGQIEVTAGVRNLTSLEMGAAWSPVPHLLVSGEAALQRIEDEQLKNRVSVPNVESHKQVGLGIGTYALTTGAKPLYLAAVAGFGIAKADVHEANLFGPNDRFQAQYWRYYAQFYLAHPSEQWTWGASMRGTWVAYQQLLQEGEAVASAATFYLEPHLFLRYGTGPLQGYATLGISQPVGHDLTANRSTMRVLAPTSSLLSVGVVFKPHLLSKMALGSR